MTHRLRSLLRPHGDERPDEQLLTAARGDPDAFADLVARHGPMVWCVCRHLLPEADAEDAFQAVFVALLRAHIRDGGALAAWLHGASVRAALVLRRQAGRRRARERAAAASEAVAAREPDDWADTMAVVHREVAALPEADRSAFVLCVLEGLSQVAAAARLGRTPGAVAGQVARAKKRLVSRLTGRGIVPACVALTVAAPVPAAVARSSAAYAAGAPVPPAVASLVKGVLPAMKWFQIKVIAVALACAVTAAVATAAAVSQDRAETAVRAAPVREAPRPAVPGPAPRLLALRPGNDGKIRMIVYRAEKQMIQPQVAVAPAFPGAPAQPVPAREVTVHVPVEAELTEIKGLEVRTPSGRAVTADAAVKALARGGVVAVSADGKAVDPAFLAALREDTLVLVSSELALPAAAAGGPIGGPVAVPGATPAGLPGGAPGGR